MQNAATAGANAFLPDNIVISLAQTNKVVWYNGDFQSTTYGPNGTAHRLTSDDGTTFVSNNINPENTSPPISPRRGPTPITARSTRR